MPGLGYGGLANTAGTRDFSGRAPAAGGDTVGKHSGWRSMRAAGRMLVIAFLILFAG